MSMFLDDCIISDIDDSPISAFHFAQVFIQTSRMYIVQVYYTIQLTCVMVYLSNVYAGLSNGDQ